MKSIAVFVAVAAAVAVSTASAESFVPGRTYLLDHDPSTGNMLFRGNNPNVNNSFAWAELTSTLSAVAANNSLTFPTQFELVDVSMLVGIDPKESGDLKVEKDFFKANPDKGKFINWPLLTDLVGPCWTPEAKRIAQAKSGKWDLDDTPSKVATLHSMVHTRASAPQVIYIHCEAGVDRTGELSGSYNMQYFNQTYQQVLAFDDGVEPRKISSGAENGLQWYALYVQYALGYAASFSC